MIYLYGNKGAIRKLVATFDSEQQLLAYVRWATLHENDDGTRKFEQGSVLTSSTGFDMSRDPPAGDAAPSERPDVEHNPSPSML